jgi:phosphoribosylglycinamide formyltransferase-1
LGFKRFNENLPVPFVQFVMQLSTAIKQIFPLVLTMTRIAIFASGAGTNAENIINYFRNHETIAVALIVCNKPGAGVLAIAARENLPTLLIEKEQFFRGNGYLPELHQHHINFLVLAGFLWKVPQSLIAAFPNAIINIHPALLPLYGGKGMFGMKVHESVVTAGEKESGITIHYVDEHYDNGDIIFQEKCPVSPDDTPETLAAKIHQLEYQHFPRVIEQVISLKKLV